MRRHTPTYALYGPKGGRSGWMEALRETHVAFCTYSHVLRVNTHVTRCASLHCASQFRAVFTRVSD